MGQFTADSIDVISDLTTHFIDIHLKEALKNEKLNSETNQIVTSKINLNRILPAGAVSFEILTKFQLVNLHSDFLIDVSYNLTEKGKHAAEIGIEAFLKETGETVRLYAENFVENQLKKEKESRIN